VDSRGRTVKDFADGSGEFSDRFAQRLFRVVSRAPNYDWDAGAAFEGGAETTREWLARFNGNLDFEAKKVLDVGCGLGATCFHMAEHGASSVVGIDIDAALIDFANQQLDGRYGHLNEVVDFHRSGGLLEGVDEHDFDLIISQDAFEHIAEPEAMVSELVSRLAPNGELAIGFSPLWHSPTGGHISHMTWLPWAHLLFPERVIMNERRRYMSVGKPWDGFRKWADVGLNQMSLHRFLEIMDRTSLEKKYLAFNVYPNHARLALALNAFRKIPITREFTTISVYGIWKKSETRPPTV